MNDFKKAESLMKNKNCQNHKSKKNIYINK